jgi:vancomycin resistance protein YoaR
VSEHLKMPELSRQTLVIIGACIAAIVVVFLGAFVATKDGVRAGTMVDGINLGGLSEAQAIAVVEETLGATSTKKFEVVLGDQAVELRPSAAGIVLNAQATVDQGMARGFNPFTVITDLVGSREIEPVIDVDPDALAEQVSSIAETFDVLPTEPVLTVTAKNISLSRGTDGVTVEQEQLAQTLVAAVLEPRAPIEAPVVTAPPRVSEEVALAAEKLAQNAVANPVRVSVDGVNITIEPNVIARALSFSQQGSQLSPELDGAVLHASIANELKGAEKPGRDATFKIVKGSPVVVPSVVGTGVSDANLATSVLGVLDNPDPNRSVVVPLGTRDPALTTEAAQQLGITEKLSSFTQQFQYAAYRVTNIGQAAKYVNGTLLLPGETFSMNDTIKERTVKNGYTVGTIIGPGGVFEDALGGGVSAATTAVWTAAFFAGMEKTDTRAHSLYISRYQPGLEATVAWGIFDMKFTNDTPNAVFITTKMTNSSMKVTFWGTKQFDEITAEFGERTNIREPQRVVNRTKKCKPQAGIPGFTITVDRVFKNDGQVVEREPMTTVYRAGPEIVCKKPKKEKPVDEITGDTFDNTVDPSASPSPSPSASSKPKKPQN